MSRFIAYRSQIYTVPAGFSIKNSEFRLFLWPIRPFYSLQRFSIKNVTYNSGRKFNLSKIFLQIALNSPISAIFFSPEGQIFLKKDEKTGKSKFFYHEAHEGTRRFNKN
jgi:hypothetical protein